MKKWSAIEQKWEKIDDFFVRISTVLSSIAFVAIVAMISLNVVSRYLFLKSFNWAEEVSYLCFNWVVFLGVVIVYRNQGLTAIDVVLNRISPTPQRILLIIGFLLVTLINVGLVVWGLEFSIQALSRKSPALKIPYFYYDISIPIAGVMLFSCSLRNLINTIFGKKVDRASLEDRV